MIEQLWIIWWWEVFESQEDYHTFLKNNDRDLMKPPKTWKSRLAKSVDGMVQVVQPNMPCAMNAEYTARKIRFERYLQHVWESISLVGRSLWGTFLLKYLSEEDISASVKQVHLVAPLLEEEKGSPWKYGGFLPNQQKLSVISTKVSEIYLYHSKDDDIVNYKQSVKLTTLLPGVVFEEFQSRWHFLQPAFPELLHNLWFYKR